MAERKQVARCVNHTRREATQKLLGVDLCGDCAKIALRSALAIEDDTPAPLRVVNQTGELLSIPLVREAQSSISLDGETQSVERPGGAPHEPAPSDA